MIVSSITARRSRNDTTAPPNIPSSIQATMKAIRTTSALLCRVYNQARPRRSLTTLSPPTEWKNLLDRVASGQLSAHEALQKISQPTGGTNEQVLETYANLDHAREKRTGFPEAVFAEGKTPAQVAAILDDMAQHADPQSTAAILATR